MADNIKAIDLFQQLFCLDYNIFQELFEKCNLLIKLLKALFLAK